MFTTTTLGILIAIAFVVLLIVSSYHEVNGGTLSVVFVNNVPRGVYNPLVNTAFMGIVLPGMYHRHVAKMHWANPIRIMYGLNPCFKVKGTLPLVFTLVGQKKDVEINILNPDGSLTASHTRRQKDLDFRVMVSIDTENPTCIDFIQQHLLTTDGNILPQPEAEAKIIFLVKESVTSHLEILVKSMTDAQVETVSEAGKVGLQQSLNNSSFALKVTDATITKRDDSASEKALRQSFTDLAASHQQADAARVRQGPEIEKEDKLAAIRVKEAKGLAEAKVEETQGIAQAEASQVERIHAVLKNPETVAAAMIGLSDATHITYAPGGKIVPDGD